MENDSEFTNKQLYIDGLPDFEELQFQVLEAKYLRVILFGNIIFYSILLLGLIVFWFLDAEYSLRPYYHWILLGFLILVVTSLVFGYKSFQHKGFAFRHKDISYKKGWIWRSVTTIPFNRVQHCEVIQGVFDRYYEIAKLKVFTAGGSTSDLTIPGLTLEHANELKGFILSKVEDYDEH